MSEWLLEKDEWEDIIAELPEGDTCGQCREAISKAALRKVASYIKVHSMKLPQSTSRRFRYTLYIGKEEFNTLMDEAGLRINMPELDKKKIIERIDLINKYADLYDYNTAQFLTKDLADQLAKVASKFSNWENLRIQRDILYRDTSYKKDSIV